jgi:aspartate aminotransferase
MSKISATIAINHLAKIKQARGITVHNLSAGEPKLLTSNIIREAAMAFTACGDIPYPNHLGQEELRDLACSFMNTSHGSSFQREQCLITTGGKFALYLLLQHLLKSSTSSRPVGVIISAPYWVSYPAIVDIMRGKSVIVATTAANGWKLTPTQLQQSYSPTCQVLILNNASNPTGALYSRTELAELLATATALGLTVISDEVYSGLCYDGEKYISCAEFAQYRNNVFIVHSMSKNFAMTGWRVGMVYADASIVSELGSLVTQSTTGVSLICQHGAIAAFQHAATIMPAVNSAMLKRRNVLLKALYEHFSLAITPPQSALYLWLSLAELGWQSDDDEEFCVTALDQANVALVPGNSFGIAGYIRMSFAADEDNLRNGAAALAQFIKNKLHH